MKYPTKDSDNGTVEELSVKEFSADEVVDLFNAFFAGSKSFAGITFSGMFFAHQQIILDAFRHFLESGENKLDEYADLQNIWQDVCGWQTNDKVYGIIDEKDISYYRKMFNRELYWNPLYIYSEDKISKINKYIDHCEHFWKEHNSHKARRHRASLYTSKKSIRKKIFDRDGKICKHCSKSEDLTLDHIQPVSKGGKNELGNLQVLCKSCNSRKSNNTDIG